jgi:GntR family transcriptional regulator, transcriptional repressor for pyruvate dehydrogenase complex
VLDFESFNCDKTPNHPGGSTMKLERINNESVVTEVLNRITDSIIHGDIKPGDKIPAEMELMEKLGVGRNSIREAIKMLVAMGVLEVRRGSGTYVATKMSDSIVNPLVFSLIIDPKSGDELYEFRKLFDTMVMLLAIDRVSKEDVETLRTILTDCQTRFDNGEHDIEYFSAADVRFHQALLEMTKNKLFMRVGSFIMALFPQYIRKSLEQPNGIQRSINNHLNIVQIIAERDKSLVYDVIENSLSEWKQNWEN